MIDKVELATDTHFRFVSLKKAACPLGWMNLSEAIERIIKNVDEAYWNRYTSICQNPLCERKGVFGEYRLPNRPTRMSRTFKRINVEPASLTEFHVLCARYYEFTEFLRETFEKGEVRLAAFGNDGLNYPPFGTWTRQRRSVFYTGFCSVATASGRERCRVLVNREDFELFAPFCIKLLIGGSKHARFKDEAIKPAIHKTFFDLDEASKK